MLTLEDKLSDPDYVLSEECTLSDMFGQIDPQFLPWKRWQCDEIKSMELAAHALNERRYETSQILGIARRMMEALQLNKTRLGDPESFERIIAIDAEMRQYNHTYGLIVHLMPAHVMRGSMFDLWSSKAKGVEKMKLECARNIDYVTGIISSCGIMEEILSEAQERIARQLTAMRAGEKWPVECAGSAK